VQRPWSPRRGQGAGPIQIFFFVAVAKVVPIWYALFFLFPTAAPLGTFLQSMAMAPTALSALWIQCLWQSLSHTKLGRRCFSDISSVRGSWLWRGGWLGRFAPPTVRGHHLGWTGKGLQKIEQERDCQRTLRQGTFWHLFISFCDPIC
jgi:hypothetical protein